MNPVFVNPGEPIKASWANDVVSSIRSNSGDPNKVNVQAKRAFKPFDVMEVKKSGGFWQLILQVGFIDGEPVKFSGTPLTDYPVINVTPSKDLFYNWKDEELVWDDPDSVADIKVLELVYDGDDFTIRNLHPQNINTSKFPPFTPLFTKDSSDNYYVALTDGYVCGRDITGITGGALTLYKPLSTRHYYGITEGQQASVVCTITKSGLLSVIPTIEIEDADEDSTHYYPEVVDGEGSGGVYHYKMCEFAGTLQNVLAGSHIDQWQDIIKIDNTDNTNAIGIGKVLKEYSQLLGKYFVRTIKKGFGKNTITTLTDEIIIRGTKKDANVAIRYGDPFPRPSPEIEWSDGYMSTGTEINGDEEVPLEPEQIDIIIPTVKELDADPQVHVANVAEHGGTIYEVRGNSKNGTLTYTLSTDSPVTVLEWVDGLVITEGEENNIPIPAPGTSSGMLSGIEGDMLYHNGVDWTLLVNPGVPPGEFDYYTLCHFGVRPLWTPHTLQTISVCISGNPTTKTFATLDV